jgi:hypothetical protein
MIIFKHNLQSIIKFLLLVILGLQVGSYGTIIALPMIKFMFLIVGFAYISFLRNFMVSILNDFQALDVMNLIFLYFLSFYYFDSKFLVIWWIKNCALFAFKLIIVQILGIYFIKIFNLFKQT